VTIVDGFLNRNSKACAFLDSKKGPIETLKQLQTSIGNRTAMRKPTMDEIYSAIGPKPRRRF
jgi:hypothetical protein